MIGHSEIGTGPQAIPVHVDISPSKFASGKGGWQLVRNSYLPSTSNQFTRDGAPPRRGNEVLWFT